MSATQAFRPPLPPNTLHLTATTFPHRRSKSLDQHTLNITNVAARPLHHEAVKRSVHPSNRASSTYQIVNKPPDRAFGEVARTKLGGETRVQDKANEWWDRGEYWNRDSNIRRWNFQEVRRHASEGAHDVHRHEQKNHEVLTTLECPSNSTSFKDTV